MHPSIHSHAHSHPSVVAATHPPTNTYIYPPTHVVTATNQSLPLMHPSQQPAPYPPPIFPIHPLSHARMQPTNIHNKHARPRVPMHLPTHICMHARPHACIQPIPVCTAHHITSAQTYIHTYIRLVYPCTSHPTYPIYVSMYVFTYRMYVCTYVWSFTRDLTDISATLAPCPPRG